MPPAHPAARPAARLAARLFATAAALTVCLAATSSNAVQFVVTNLVSDGSVPAVTVDHNLINPWGVSYGPTSPFWVSDNGTGVSTLYNGSGGKLGLTVAVPDSPTGQVFNATANSFQINGTKPVFLFDTEDGKIAGWAPSFGTTAQNAVTSTTGAIYKGLALGSAGGNDMLFAADFHGGVVESYQNSFATHATFTDPDVAAGFAPFNVQVLNGQLFVTFAKQDGDRADDVAGAGNGYVDVFNLDGTFNRRIASLGDAALNSPWGLAIAPSSFGHFAGDLLVGNFGDGTISAFNLATNAFDGKLLGTDGQPLVFGDLWALVPGNGGPGADPLKIYLTAGLEDEAHGLFASLTAVPEPESWALLIAGFGLTGAALRRRNRILRQSSPQ